MKLTDKEENKTVYTDIMIDLETLSTKVTGVFHTIAAVPFNIETGQYDRDNSFLAYVNVDDFIKLGGSIEWSVIKFWLDAEQEAKDIFIQSDGDPLAQVLFGFTQWYKDLCLANDNNLIVWGNGASFDLGMIKHAFNLINAKEPWPFYAENDVRTIVRLNKKIKRSMPFEGIPHVPTDDAIHEVKYVCETYRQTVVSKYNR